MTDLTFTPTQPNPTRRGRTSDPAWLTFRAKLNKLRDGQWYQIDLRGLSFSYARRLAIQAGFNTQAQDGTLKICYPLTNGEPT